MNALDCNSQKAQIISLLNFIWDNEWYSASSVPITNLMHHMQMIFLCMVENDSTYIYLNMYNVHLLK